MTSAVLSPAMTGPEIACYTRHLSRDTALLEYGAGGSTSLAAELGVRSLYSVESDLVWLGQVGKSPAVRAMLAAGTAKLVHIDLGRVGRWGKPKTPLMLHRWPRYAHQPWHDGYSPSLVLVDGRFRVSCILQALRLGQAGTKVAVHDFWPRRHMHAILPLADIVDSAGSLVVLQRKATWRPLRTAWLRARHLFDRR